MKTTQIFQSNSNQNQTNFKGTFHFAVPLGANSLTKLNMIEDSFRGHAVTAKFKGADSAKKCAYMKIATNGEQDFALVTQLCDLVKKIREGWGSLNVYRSANTHGLNEQELRNIKIDTPDYEIF